MVIIGIDPGYARIGYGIINKNNGKLTHIQNGLLKTNKENQYISVEKEIEKLIKKNKPVIVGVEKLFLVKNKKTAIRVAENRGVILHTIAKNNIKIVELSPSEIKLSVTGNGRASKPAVAKMVGYFLRISTENIIDDATDALAIAIAASSSMSPASNV